MSCARTVSDSEKVIEIEITLTTRGSSSSSSTIYVIAFSDIENIEPESPIDNYYYIFPGREYSLEILEDNDETVNNYYNNTYNSWQQFIYINDTSTYFTSVNSNITSTSNYFESTTTNNYVYKENISFEYSLNKTNNNITIICDIEQLNFVENQSVYVSIFTFAQDANTESGYIKDYLGSSTLINLSQYNDNFFDTIENTLIDDTQDIIQWSYKVY